MDQNTNSNVPESTNSNQNGNTADMDTLAALLQQIRDENTKEQKYTKKLLRWMQLTMSIMMIVIIVLFAGIVSYVPRVNSLLTKADKLAEETTVVMEDLEVVSAKLAKVDYEGTIDNVNGLVVDSQKSVNEAMEKITAIDFEGLNNAITDLESVVSPLAKLFGKK